MFKWWKKFMEQLAKASDETFNGQRMDCCAVNKKNKEARK